MTRSVPFALILTALAGGAASAESAGAASVDAVRARIEEAARTLDADRDGLVSPGEMRAAAEAAFPTFDADGSGDVDPAEFRGWRFGHADVARFRGRAQAFDAVTGFVFDLFDVGGDGRLDRGEFLAALDASLRYADRDGDGARTRDEYLRGFIGSVALRHAVAE